MAETISFEKSSQTKKTEEDIKLTFRRVVMQQLVLKQILQHFIRAAMPIYEHIQKGKKRVKQR